MRILVNALSVTNLSGRHVLLGHLSQLANWSSNEYEFIILFHESNKAIRTDFGTNVKWRQLPKYTTNWILRSVWEQTLIHKLIKQEKIDVLFLPSGISVPNLNIPQITLAQNPWCLMPEVHKNVFEKSKALVQRQAYKNAMRISHVMAFNSEYMRQAYRKNAGFREKSSLIVYQGINDDTHKAAKSYPRNSKRLNNQIVSVSVMAPHKNAETLVHAVSILNHNYKLPCKLLFIGAWPDKSYENKIRKLVYDLKLNDQIEFKGHVSRQKLYSYYAESKVFCLMSLCESFGIPAVEAQSFGTPVVSSNCCAIPEVCGEGGIYLAPMDPYSVADKIAELLTNETKWQELSQDAIKNSKKYRWELCSRPLFEIFHSFQNCN
jgi:glycosyltransferase involved in cell wall biosynthesis